MIAGLSEPDFAPDDCAATELRQQAAHRLRQKSAELSRKLKFGTLELFAPTEIIGVELAEIYPEQKRDTFYWTFPYLFYELFPQIPLEHYDTLAQSISLYFSYMLVVDRLLDGRVKLEPAVAFEITSMHQRVITWLALLFPVNSPFWAFFDQCRRENAQALTLERLKHIYSLTPYSEEEMLTIAAGKSAMAKAGIAALSFLAQESVRDDLIASCEAFHVGIQLLDDLGDWRSDYRDHLYTPLLTQVILDCQLEDQVEGSDRLDVNTIGSLIYTQGYAQATLAQAIDYFKLARQYVRQANCPAWHDLILSQLQQCREQGDTLDIKLDKIRQKHQTARMSQPATIAHQPLPLTEPLHSVFPIYEPLVTNPVEPATNVSSYLQDYGAVLTDFWQATNISAQAARANLQRYAQQPPVWMPPTVELVEVCESTVAQCQQAAALPQGLSIYLLLGGDAAGAVSFYCLANWQIGIALDRWLYPSDNGQAKSESMPLETLKHFLRMRTAYEYGRILRLHHAPPPTCLLDELCLEGLALAFAQELCPAIPWEAHIGLAPGTLDWFEHNRQYLWREVHDFLPSFLPERFYFNNSITDCERTGAPIASCLGYLLGYDMATNYRRRIGRQSWTRLAQVSSRGILRKGIVGLSPDSL